MPEVFHVGGGIRGREAPETHAALRALVMQNKRDTLHGSHLFSEGQWNGEKSRKLEPHVSRSVR